MSRCACLAVCSLTLVLSLAAPHHAAAAPVVVDFESLGDLESLTTQIPGLTFGGATALSAGISLNEFEVPPHSGRNVVYDDGGVMTIAFDTPVSNVGGYFTYFLLSAAQLTLTAFDSQHVAIGAPVQSFFASNMALSGAPGSTPNEFLFLPYAGIAFITIAGDPGGGSFVLDDLTFTASTPQEVVPEPATMTLLLSGAALLGLERRRAARARKRR
jgi:hypothetical protein